MEPNPNLSETDPIETLRDRSTTCGRFWTEGLPYWLLAEVCLALAAKVDELEGRLGDGAVTERQVGVAQSAPQAPAGPTVCEGDHKWEATSWGHKCSVCDAGKIDLRTCPKCGSKGVAFICSERGCPVNGGAAYG